MNFSGNNRQGRAPMRPAYRQGAGPRPPQSRPVNVHRTSGGNNDRNYERYIALAKEARLRGDLIEMENCYQHAEHYFRVMKEQERR
jgi:Domain of unknown function (DUF4167)